MLKVRLGTGSKGGAQDTRRETQQPMEKSDAREACIQYVAVTEEARIRVRTKTALPAQCGCSSLHSPGPHPLVSHQLIATQYLHHAPASPLCTAFAAASCVPRKRRSVKFGHTPTKRLPKYQGAHY